MAFGGETVDSFGVIRPFPAASMLTGMLANALGWRRIDREHHQGLQDRLVFAARIDQEPSGGLSMQDFQSATINNTQQGWTTRGYPEGRGGGAYQNHLRYRDYFADMIVTVALRLDPVDGEPTLEVLANALREPARPLFIGRKPCLPSGQLFAGFIDGDTALTALVSWPIARVTDNASPVRALWPEGEGMADIDPNQRHMLTDQRNWVSGLHGGGRTVCEGLLDREQFPPGPTEPTSLEETAVS